MMPISSLQSQILSLQDTSAAWSAGFCRFSAHEISAWLLKHSVLFLDKMLLLTILLTTQCNYCDFPITIHHIPFSSALDISSLLHEKTLFFLCVDYIKAFHEPIFSHLWSRVGSVIHDNISSQLKVPDYLDANINLCQAGKRCNSTLSLRCTW